MSTANDVPPHGEDPRPPHTDRGKAIAAAILLLIPIVALMWVPSYGKEDPALGPFPFFFWYQFLWVFICSAMTYSAYRLMLSARAPRSGRSSVDGER